MFQYPIDDELALQLPEPRHADELFALVDNNREHLRRWLGWIKDDYGIAETRNFIRRAQEQWADNDGYNLTIVYRGAIAGGVGQHSIRELHRSTSIGYWLGAQFEGKGIMTRACRALVSISFSVQNLHRVEIRAATGNARSQHVAERLGFSREGVIRDVEWLYDHYVDHVVYGMLAHDWK